MRNQLKQAEETFCLYLPSVEYGVMADDYLKLTRSTTVPIHTGEKILRQNFRKLIERNAIRVIGPDVADVDWRN